MMRVRSPPRRRRLGRARVLLLLSGVLLCVVYTLTLKERLSPPPDSANTGGAVEVSVREARASGPSGPPGSTDAPLVVTVNRTDIEQCIYVNPKPSPPPPPPTAAATPPPRHRKGDYPEDLFSLEQRQRGWAGLHVVGMIYMFVALAIVCDEFFVPGLEVITNRLQISDDVAGATFMAAGGSAPELFTSLIGVFVSHSNVGIGTIVGSAVFNILFVIGMCAIFSREMLHLTWWPLFRDVSFYILDLIMLIVFFLDSAILWWESILLVLAYVSYVSFMKFNSQIEQVVKNQISKHMNIVKVWSAEEPEKESDAPAAAPPLPAAAVGAADKSNPEPDAPLSSPPLTTAPTEPQEDRTRLRVRPALQRGGSSASLHNTSLRNTIFQLMIHTLDPLGEARNKVKPLNVPVAGKSQNESQRHRAEGAEQEPKGEDAAPAPAGAAGGAAAEASTSQPPNAEETAGRPEVSEGAAEGSGSSDSSEEDESSSESEDDDDDDGNEEEEEENEPLSLKWPESRRKQATYLLLLPIVFPLWLTLPDVRNPASRRYFVASFLGSILWIGVFSYLMVWWAHQVGETVGISEEIMGLTILAAGTSIPDLITSVIVARKGLGDMAVSSSVGSNIFDITVGLPVPWLIYTVLHNGQPVTVSSNGLFCAIVLLFLMLLFVIISIAACRWKMSRMLGLTMFVLYFVFLILSVLLEDRVLICPVSI